MNYTILVLVILGIFSAIGIWLKIIYPMLMQIQKEEMEKEYGWQYREKDLKK